MIEQALHIFELDRKKDNLTEKEIQYLNSLNDEQLNELINYCTKMYNYHNAMQMLYFIFCISTIIYFQITFC